MCNIYLHFASFFLFYSAECEHPPTPVCWHKEGDDSPGDTIRRLKQVRTKLISVERELKHQSYLTDWNAELVRYGERSPPSEDGGTCGITSWDDVATDDSSCGENSLFSDDYTTNTTPEAMNFGKSWWSGDDSDMSLAHLG